MTLGADHGLSCSLPTRQTSEKQKGSTNLFFVTAAGFGDHHAKDGDCLAIDGVCTKSDGVCTTSDGVCTKSDGVCTTSDGDCSASDRGTKTVHSA